MIRRLMIKKRLAMLRRVSARRTQANSAFDVVSQLSDKEILPDEAGMKSQNFQSKREQTLTAADIKVRFGPIPDRARARA